MTVEDEVQEEFEDFWRSIVCLDGEWDLDQVKRELHDYSMMLKEVPKVFHYVTNGRISKPNIHASAVIGVFDELWKPLDET